jgi:dienelactone hydrolase
MPPRSLLGALACAALVAPSAAHAADRGTLLHAQPIAHLSRDQTAARVTAVRLPREPALPTRPIHFGADAYRLTYSTVGVDGSPTTATGLVLLPRNGRRHLLTVSYAHGTMAARADAPSRSLDSLASASALLFAGAGYATVAPDYLGLGYGPGPHPYLHLATEASASLDLLRAAHTFALSRHRQLDGDTFVTGFSQGGAAAMALGKALQDGTDPRLHLAALAPMSGPYDLEHAELPALFAGKLDSADSNYYLSYAMREWQPIYHVFDAPTDVWLGDWANRAPALFDGRRDDVAILKVLPRRLDRLFTPAFRARLAHPDGGLLEGLRANDVGCDWAPAAPVRLYAARGDEQVAFANSRSCAAALASRGVHAPLVDMGATGHFGSTLRATPRVLAFFQRIQTPSRTVGKRGAQPSSAFARALRARTEAESERASGKPTRAPARPTDELRGRGRPPAWATASTSARWVTGSSSTAR